MDVLLHVFCFDFVSGHRKTLLSSLPALVFVEMITLMMKSISVPRSFCRPTINFVGLGFDG